MKLLSAFDLTALPPPVYLVDGLIEQRSLSLLAAPSGAGKSHVAVDLACSLAMGFPFAGRHEVVQGPIIYIAAEGGRSLQKRIAAWAHYRQIQCIDLPVYFIIEPVRLREPEQLNSLCELLDQRVTDDHNLSPSLLIIDTLSQSFGSGDENTMDMQEFCDCMAYLRDERDMAVMVLHHMNAQGSKERGHTSLKAAMDHSFKVTGIRGGDGKGLKKVIMLNDKNKDDIEAEKITFSVVPHMSSVVLEPIATHLSVESVQLRENSKQMLVLANIAETEGDYAETSELKKRTNLEDKYLHQAIDDLIVMGLIKKTGRGKYFVTTKGIWTQEQNRINIEKLRNIDY